MPCRMPPPHGMRAIRMIQPAAAAVARPSQSCTTATATATNEVCHRPQPLDAMPGDRPPESMPSLHRPRLDGTLALHGG